MNDFAESATRLHRYCGLLVLVSDGSSNPSIALCDRSFRARTIAIGLVSRFNRAAQPLLVRLRQILAIGRLTP